MPVFASTTTSGYSDPLKAMSIKALEQRYKDMQAQQATQQAAMFSPENTQTPVQGLAQVANVAVDAMRSKRADEAVAAQKMELAKVMAGMNIDQPTAQEVAKVNMYDPELARQMLTTLAENRRTFRGQDVTVRGQDVGANVATRGQDVTVRGQDVGAGTTIRGQDVAAGTTVRGQDVAADTARRGQDITVRGQDVGADTARRGQDITVRGQDVGADTARRGQDVTVRGQDVVSGDTRRGQDVTVRGQDVGADTATRGQDVVAGTTVRGQDVAADTARRGQDITVRGQDIGQDTAVRGQDVAADTARRGQDVTVRGQDITKGTTERGQDLANRVKMDDLTKGTSIQSDYARHAQALDNLHEAEGLLDKGINSGFWGNAQTKAAQIATGKWGTDADAAARTTRFNQLMDEQAIIKMSAQLKGQTTNFEMDEFKKIMNNPNASIDDRRNALRKLIGQAQVDKAAHASAATAAQKQIGGPTVQEIDATLATARGGGGGGGVVSGITEEEALKLERGTRYKLKDGRTGVVE